MLQWAKELPQFQALGGEGNVALYREHFFLMHCLYRLQLQLVEEGAGLQIEALCIRLLVCRDQTEGLAEYHVDEKLRDYYLDLLHIDASAEEVAELLNNFWQSFQDYLQGDEALTVLGLDTDASMADIKVRYRTLAAEHHPDKGGDHEEFIQIRHAYESLKRART